VAISPKLTAAWWLAAFLALLSFGAQAGRLVMSAETHAERYRHGDFIAPDRQPYSGSEAFWDNPGL
jgi:hypothetical protein